MYDINILREDIELIKKYNKVIKESNDKFKEYIDLNYIDNNVIIVYDYCCLCEESLKIIFKNVDLQTIINKNENNKYDEEIFCFSKINTEYLNLLENYKYNKKIIEEYIDLYLTPLNKNLIQFFSLCNLKDDEINYILKFTSNLFILNKLEIINDIEYILNIMSKVNNEIIANFIELTYNKIKQNKLYDNQDISIDYYEDNDKSIQVMDLNDLLGKLKNQKKIEK